LIFSIDLHRLQNNTSHENGLELSNRENISLPLKTFFQSDTVSKRTDTVKGDRRKEFTWIQQFSPFAFFFSPLAPPVLAAQLTRRSPACLRALAYAVAARPPASRPARRPAARRREKLDGAL
jgi:hypothetical protein